MSHNLQSKQWREKRNLVPLPYRRVSVQPYSGPMTAEAIESLLMEREAYRRTDFIVLKGKDKETAVVAHHPCRSRAALLLYHLGGSVSPA
ncbi:MAG: hypothetical protein U0401_16240 [Anaerolineae bacterium]